MEEHVSSSIHTNTYMLIDSNSHTNESFGNRTELKKKVEEYVVQSNLICAL